MCGIAGVVGRDLGRDAGDFGRSLCSSLGHRGPDGSGLYHDPSGRALLAHTRLSIIDLSEDAAQPITFDGRHFLVYNGEIYNHGELRAGLEKEGVSFRTSSDSEVLLRLLLHRGPGALSLLQGMFALALWDSRDQTLLLARDPFGIKPLYIAAQGNSLAFASELRTLILAHGSQPRLSPRGLAEFLQWGCSGRLENLVEGMEKLPPGTVLEWKNGRTKRWVFSKIPIVLRENNATTDDFRTAWLDAVARHFVSDVPVGLLLSGGMDSAAVIAAAAAQGKKTSLALTLHFGGTLTGEAREAAELAAYFKTPHVAHELAPAEIPSLFQSHLDAQDYPSMDGFNIYCISHAAHRLGLKVMLTGLGGDELLGGYPSFTRIPRVVALLRSLPDGLRPRQILRNWGHVLGSSRWARMLEWAAGPATWSHAYACYRGVFPQSSIRDMLDFCRVGPQPAPDHGLTPNGPEWIDGRSHIARWEFIQYLQQQLLGDGDACSMAFGVELRHPFLDEVLWRTGASLPSSIRFDSRKKILRTCLPELPPAIFRRPKLGFSMPYESWFKGPLHDFESFIPPELSRHATTWYQKTALIALFHWLQRHRISL